MTFSLLLLLLALLTLFTPSLTLGSQQLQCLTAVGEKVNIIKDSQCQLLESSSPWSYPEHAPWGWIELGLQSCCHSKSLNLTSLSQTINLNHKSTAFLIFKASFTVWSFSFHELLQFNFDYFDKDMNYIDSQTLELESLLIPLYEAPLIEIPPSAQILKFSVIVENPNICFDYFYLELIETANGVGDIITLASAFTIFFFLVIAQAVVIPLILLFRYNGKKKCFFFGLPGPNLLEHQKSRWAPSVIFMVTIQWFFSYSVNIIFGDGVANLIPSKEGQMFQIFIYMGLFAFAAVLYWPLFLCYEQRHRFLAVLLGMFSSATLFTTRFLSSVTIEKEFLVTQSVIGLPELIGLPTIFLFFSYRLFLLIQGKTPTVHEIANKRDFLYVRQLLEKKVQEEPIIETNQSFCEKVQSTITMFFSSLRDPAEWKRVFEKYIWKNEKTFRFPQRLIASTLMLLVVIYDFSVLWVSLGFNFAPNFSCFIATIFRESNEESLQFAKRMIGIIQGASIGIALLAFVFGGIQVLFCLKSYKQDISKLNKGDYSRLEKIKTVNFNDTLRFVGFQIGFGFLGCLINLIFFSVVLAILICIAEFETVRVIIWEYLILNLFLVPVIVTILFTFFQSLLTKVFLEGHEGWRVKHRKSFQNYDYLFIFINMVRGLLSFVSRLVLGICVLIVFSYRIDKALIVESFDWLDKGHKSYLGMLAASHQYNNQIMKTFIHLLYSRETNNDESVLELKDTTELQEDKLRELEENTLEKGLLNNSSYQYGDVLSKEGGKIALKPHQEISSIQRKHIRNRFFLWITLTNNPSLRAFRRKTKLDINVSYNKDNE